MVDLKYFFQPWVMMLDVHLVEKSVDSRVDLWVEMMADSTDFVLNIGGAIRFGASNMNITFIRSSFLYNRSPSVLDLTTVNESVSVYDNGIFGPRRYHCHRLKRIH